MILLYIILGISGYMTMALATGWLAWVTLKDEDVVFLPGLLWPVMLLPFLVISAYCLLAKWNKRDKYFSRSQRKEISSLKHQIEKAKLEAELEDVTTARLERMR